jgi:hypothetical protein
MSAPETYSVYADDVEVGIVTALNPRVAIEKVCGPLSRWNGLDGNDLQGRFVYAESWTDEPEIDLDALFLEMRREEEMAMEDWS